MLAFRGLTTKFLAWSAIHQEPRTTEYYENYAVMFLAHLGEAADKTAEEMKPYHVEEWVDSHHEEWGNNYKRGAVVTINRIFNWGVKSGHVSVNPIRSAHKPSAKRRETYMKPMDYDNILSKLSDTDPFKDVLVFTWIVGCRPQEVRHIEPRHVNLEGGYILFPANESKGKRTPRRIIMNDEAKSIIVKHMAKNPDGKVFRNTRNEAWTKFAVCNRMSRLSKLTGTKMTLYSIRHGFGTRKLKAGHGHLAIAATMGHSDGSMLAKIYSHISEDDEHLRTVLND